MASTEGTIAGDIEILAGDAAAIDHEHGLAYARAVDTDAAAPAWRVRAAADRARNQGGELREIAAIQRQVQDLLAADDLPHNGGFARQDRGFGGNRDGILISPITRATSTRAIWATSSLISGRRRGLKPGFWTVNS